MTSLSRTWLYRIAAVIALSLVSGCGEDPRRDGDSANKVQAGDHRTVALVAASAKNVVEEIAAAFEKETGNKIVVSAGPTNALANQIIAGGDAHLFLSANTEWADAVEKAGRAAARQALLTNGLVLVVPTGGTLAIRTPVDLRSPDVKRIAIAGDNVPAGAYAREALAAQGLFDDLERTGKIVRGHDVRATLTYVERGEADAGVVYSTDARIASRVTVVHTFDPKTYPRIVYPLVLLKAKDNDAARKFYDYLASPAAAEVYRRQGFERIVSEH